LSANNEKIQQNLTKNNKYEQKWNENGTERNWNGIGTKTDRGGV
jgi:hypothetical protein